MKRLVAALLLFLPTICACVEYPVTGKDGRVWIVPDDYRVDPNLYPKYRAIRDFQPPDLFLNPHNESHLKMPYITTDYVWEVRHRVGEKLWIFSEAYYARKCQIRRCLGTHVFEISISQDGRPESGWRKIENPKYVGMRGNRAIPVNTDSSDLPWGDQPLFEPIK
jgi:hypothetical protein